MPDSKSVAITISTGALTSELQPLQLLIEAIDGTQRTPVGTSDFARWFQVLPNGDVAFVSDGQLTIFDSHSGHTRSAGRASPIAHDDPTNDLPFLVSNDESYVATITASSISVQNLQTGDSHTVTQSLDTRRWAPYAWSPTAPILAYADQDARRVPALHLYDAATGTTTDLISADARAYTDLEWTPDASWLLFAKRPGGTEDESGAQYVAIDPATREIRALFQRGLGLRLSGRGHRLVLYRDPAGTDPGGNWVATITYH